MRYCFAKLIAAATLSVCCWAGTQVPPTSTVPTNSAHSELLRLWSAAHLHSWERAEAVNRHFTNGTPIPVIIAVLGTNFTYDTPYSSVWISPGPEPTKTIGLIYSFGDESVIIGTTAPLLSSGVRPLRAKFTGAGYSKPASRPITKSESQLGGAANRSQPVGSETNRTPAAAGSGR